METKNKTPWGEGKPWKTKSSFMVYLRGCLRLAWKRNPIKLNLIKKKRKRIEGKKEGTTRWGGTCSLCKEDFPQNMLEVDHIVPAGSLKDIPDIQGFVERLLIVTEDDLRIVCKQCNKSLAYAEKQGISYEEAVIEKQVIESMKQSTEKQKIELRRYGFSEEEVSNHNKRRECYRKLWRGDES